MKWWMYWKCRFAYRNEVRIVRVSGYCKKRNKNQMKIIKFIITLFLTILIVGLIGFYFIRQNTLSNLEEKKNNVTVCWEKFDTKLNERDIILLIFNLTNTDSLKFFIEQSKIERKNKSKILEFEFNEYKLNDFLLRNCQDKNNVTDSLFRELNNIRIEYNSYVQDFNLYYTMFPNIIFAKQKGYRREKYFSIEYGKENQNPIEKSKEIPEWAQNVDPTFLSE